MRLLGRLDPHARYLELISSQLDEPLALDDAWQLTVHLSACERCCAAERDYRQQRRRLRGLAQLTPPRDLGARVSAALDREVLRPAGVLGGGRALRRPAGPWLGRPSAGASSAVISLAVLAVGALAVVGGLPWGLPQPTLLRPTPLAVPGQALAYLGAGPDGLAIYRTSVDRVCPVSALDCVEQSGNVDVLSLSREMKPSNLALSPSGERLAISGHDGDGNDDIFAVVLMPPSRGSAPPSAPTSDPVAPTSPPVATPGEPGDRTPAVDPGAKPTPMPVATVGSTPPGATPVVPAATGSLDPTAAALTVLAILEGVRGAGAPPAWSADGGALAFSAMPADGSHGPDLYVWQPGEETARAVTTDHATYFASWSGAHVVTSRISVVPGDEDESPLVSVTTVVIDPLTGTESTVEGPPMWLPQVNGPRTHAVAWRGTFEVLEAIIKPAAGELFVFDWRLLDPHAVAVPGQAATDGPASVTPTDEPAESPAEPTTTPDGSASPTPMPPTPTPRLPGLLTLPPIESPSATPTTRPSATPEGPTPTPTPEGTVPVESVEPDDQLEPPVGTLVLMPLEPARDATSQPVLDWDVRWAPDGTAVGFWIADVPGASWGRLTVLPLDPATGALDLDHPLLAPTLARRSFTLGLNRVAWVGPAESTPEGQLRIVVWGPGGSGELRFNVPDLRGVLAAF